MAAKRPPPMCLLTTAEASRLHGTSADPAWRRWGPYVSDRQWGTVREDYSPGGTAWEYLPHDHARSRAYRWGEDGIAGWSDDQGLWCLAVALWNGRDPILKERLFGLTNSEGNHGEDVKELYFHSDGVPSHAYMRMLYKYPQAAFPYAQLTAENRRRGPHEPEFELIDTGLFDAGRYFDVTVEYAKATPEDVLMRVTVRNHAAEPARLHLLPQLWARNTWSWTPDAERPLLRARADSSVDAAHPLLAPRRLWLDGAPDLLFCENETNVAAPLWDRHAGAIQGRHQRFRRGRRRRRRQPVCVKAPNAPPTMCWRSRPARPRRSACASGRRTTQATPSPTSTRCSRAASPKRTNSMPCYSAGLRIPMRAWCSGRRWPACCGRSSSTTSTSPNGSPAIRRSRHRPRTAGTAATRTGSTSTMPTSSRCRTSGSIPGMRPGIWRSTASPSR